MIETEKLRKTKKKCSIFSLNLLKFVNSIALGNGFIIATRECPDTAKIGEQMRWMDQTGAIFRQIFFFVENFTEFLHSFDDFMFPCKLD